MSFRPCFRASSLWLLVIMPLLAHGAGTNTIPYMDNFESYAPGSSIADENGWYLGTPIDLAVVTNEPDHGLTSPYMPSAAHTKVVDLVGIISNQFSGSAQSRVYVDVMIKSEATTPPETMDPVPQVAVYVSTNNQLVFYHSYFDDVSGYNLVWTTNEVDTVPTNQWVRLTLTLDYRSSVSWFDAYFQIQVNGGPLYSNALGYAEPRDNAAPTTGSWFMAANADAAIHGGSSFQTFNSFTVDGIAQLDDLAIWNSPPSPSESTTNGTPYAWLDYYNLRTLAGGDYDAADWYDDGDGMAAWEEYYAGTDPTNPDSVLRIISVDTDWRIVWFGGTNGASTPYNLYMSTNLLDPGAWSWLTNRPRNATPTNEWTHAQGATYPKIFYKVTAQ